MTAKTGRPRGRPPGAKNKRNVDLQAEIAAVAVGIEHSVPNAFPGDAHAYLMRVYKDPQKTDQVRIDAAKAAIKFEKPQLQMVEHSGSIDLGLGARLDGSLKRLEDRAEIVAETQH